jgi:hypothetical protein
MGGNTPDFAWRAEESHEKYPNIQCPRLDSKEANPEYNSENFC